MAEFGNILLLVACLLSLMYLFLPLVTYYFITIIIFFCTSVSMIVLIYCHITNDFSLENVYYYSHTTKPLIYKICGTWGNKEGSMLLWNLVLAFYLFLMNIFIYDNNELKKLSLITQGLICFCFLLFTLFESNPFVKMPNIEMNGLGFNPILQDIGLAIHPPILYLGYLGFSVPFSLSIAGLIANSDGNLWAKVIKPWVLVSCSLLTLGIGFGSWWAYRELGWGGFWFWDPVENVSLMLWLIAVTLVHLLLLVRNFNILRNFAILLALTTFILSITGTFLVRSGMLISVHAFTNDPKHGVFILVLLSVITVSSLTLFLVFTKKNNCSFTVVKQRLTLEFKKKSINDRVAKIAESKKFFSHLTIILVNNLLFITAFFAVLVGTLYPLIFKYLTGRLISVGAQYYNSLFNPITLVILILMIVGHYSDWQENSLLSIFRQYRFSFCSAAAILPFVLHMDFMIALSISISIALLVFIFEAYSKKIRLFKTVFTESILLAKKLSKSYYAMMIAHAGIAILVLGVTCLVGWQEKKENYLKIGDNITINKFKIILRDIELIKKKNLHAVRGTMDVINLFNNKIIGEVMPEYRFYLVEGKKNVESSIHHNLFSDIYVIIGEIDKSRSRIATKVHYKPGMPVIWLGFLLISLGSFIAALPSSLLRRFR
ncbi:MAG: heme lyase CcmF/NrfE family subunit [Wolbachia endosymbiont of Meromenopon meropis]|nr:heme lyase CcmF/NrfE family subunit [Wolbachia endosymbiont of Meromenopon meropis]